MKRLLRIYALLLTLALSASVGSMLADDEEFNPIDPPEPGRRAQVTITANLPEGVTYITPSELKHVSTSLFIRVTPKENYRLVHWTLNGTVYTTEQSFTYVVGDSAANFVAVLVKRPTITLQVTPEGAGTTRGAGIYNAGSNVQIYAYENTGYTFLHWLCDEVIYTTNKNFRITVNDDITFVAVYQKTHDEPEEPDPYGEFDPDNPPDPLRRLPVSVDTDLPEGVAVSHTLSTTHAEGAVVTVSTSTVSGYRFTHWTLNGYLHSEERSFTYHVADSAAAFVAHYVKLYNITVGVEPKNAGTVSASGSYAQGENISFTTVAKQGYVFDYWTCNGERFSTGTTCTYTVRSQDEVFVAHYHEEVYEEVFEEEEVFNPYNPPEPLAQRVALNIRVYANDKDAGYITGVPTTALYAGDEITITAVPASNCYYFIKWADNGSPEPVRTLTLTGDATFVAVFASYKYTISADAQQPTMGEASVDYDYSLLHAATNIIANCGDDIWVTATPATGYHFTLWNDGNMDNPRLVNVSHDSLFTASFAINKYLVSFYNADGTMLKSDSIEHGNLPTAPDGTPVMDATAQYTFTFAGWDKEIVAATEDIVYTALYDTIINRYTIIFYDDDRLTVLCSDEYEYGEMPTCDDPQKPADEQYTYTFAGWSPKVSIVTSEATYIATYNAHLIMALTSTIVEGKPQKVIEDYRLYILLPDGSKYSATGVKVD